MDKAVKIPPVHLGLISTPEALSQTLGNLLNTEFHLTTKTKTDGSRLRRVVAGLLAKSSLPQECAKGQYQVLPKRGKGVPKILREYLDTYIVTSGKSYNLQVWNRDPVGTAVLVKYGCPNTNPLLEKDVRYVLIYVAGDPSRIQTIAILSPDYIVRTFGKFGVVTVKHQLMIPDALRLHLAQTSPHVLFIDDAPSLQKFVTKKCEDIEFTNPHASPVAGQILSLATIRDLVAEKLLGRVITGKSTKVRGQKLESILIDILGYQTKNLAGGCPDIRHQFLEVKVQDSRTIDLGRESPQDPRTLKGCLDMTTLELRYLIALTNPMTSAIESIILAPGHALAQHLTFVLEPSGKRQRQIPMHFFETFKGMVVIDPNYLKPEESKDSLQCSSL